MDTKYFGHRGKTARVLRHLRLNGQATNAELNRICFRYGSVIHELRKEGWKISTHRINNDGLYKFVFHGHEDEEYSRPNFIHRFVGKIAKK